MKNVVSEALQLKITELSLRIQGGNVGGERHDNWGTVKQREDKWDGDRVDTLKMYKNLYKV